MINNKYTKDRRLLSGKLKISVGSLQNEETCGFWCKCQCCFRVFIGVLKKVLYICENLVKMLPTLWPYLWPVRTHWLSTSLFIDVNQHLAGSGSKSMNRNRVGTLKPKPDSCLKLPLCGIEFRHLKLSNWC